MKRFTFAVLSLAVAMGLAQVRAQEPQGPQVGIKVHGHWVIDVKNADGSFVSHREFENALTPTGAYVLSGLLSRRLVTGSWSITLSSSSTSPCGTNPGGTSPRACAIGEPQVSPVNSTNLVVSANLGAGTTTLSGSFQAPQAGALDSVRTWLGACDQANPTSCLSYDFSGTTISAVTLAAGQIVQVSVTFSFS